MEISHRKKRAASRLKMTLFFVGSGMFLVGSVLMVLHSWKRQSLGRPIAMGLGSSFGYALSFVLFLLSIGYCAKALYWRPREGEGLPSQTASNQLPDPTSPSVTPAADAAGAPSVAADH